MSKFGKVEFEQDHDILPGKLALDDILPHRPIPKAPRILRISGHVSLAELGVPGYDSSLDPAEVILNQIEK